MPTISKTTIEAVQNQIGAQVIAQSDLSSDNVRYQQEYNNNMTYPVESVIINFDHIDTRRRLLKDLYENSGLFVLVAIYSEDVAPTERVENLKTKLNSLIKDMLDALNQDKYFNNLAFDSEVIGIHTDSGYSSAAGKAVARIYLNVIFFTES
jgi:hypothetical protein